MARYVRRYCADCKGSTDHEVVGNGWINQYRCESCGRKSM